MRNLLAAALLLASAGCDKEVPDSPLEWKSESATPLPSATAPVKKATAKPAATAAPVEEKKGYARLDRATFNKMAMRLNEPVYWAKDGNNDGIVDPGEVAALLFFPTEGKWTTGGKFTDDFSATYDKMVAASKAPEPTGADGARQKLLIAELDAAGSVLVDTSTKGWSEEDMKLLKHMITTAHLIDDLHAQQLGLAKVADKVAKDPASQSVFRRDWGVRCKTPRFEKTQACSAAPGMDDAPVDVWPAELQKEKGFCKKIEEAKNKKDLMTPFSVVVDDGGKLTAKGYDKVYGEGMKKVADELKATAADVTDPKEAPLADYLNAAAKAFDTNKWEPADEKWAKMNARNSKWYVRVAPDEVQWDPCSLKAGFHLTFARINTGSLDLQDKLTPLQQEMEDTLAKLIGDPYKSRKVTFHLPDFIDIVLNAGDDRDAIGATVGQSLPNWGPVGNEGRGRTVAMTNLYNDPDSLVVRRQKAASLLTADAMKDYVDEGGPGLLGTVLHEATHNLGPSHEYKYQGKKDDEAFGGDLAAMIEELKAQSGAFYYLYLLQEKGIIKEEEVRRTIVDNLVWGLGHVSRGMTGDNNQRKPYSQLAAIQIGFLMDEGVFIWDPNATPAAKGSTDKGAFRIDFSKAKDAIDKMMKVVATIKAKNDKAAGLDLANKYVEEKSSNVPQATVRERLLRFPQPNFVYAITE